MLALWFFAGFHKLFSAGYYSGVMVYLLSPVSSKFSPSVYHTVGAAGALFEMSLAVLAIVPRTRRVAAVLGAAMHGALFLWLAIALRWNSAVWGWNLTLAVASVALLWPWRSQWIVDWRGASVWARAIAALVLLSPIGYYFGLIDAFMAHCVYANNTPEAWIVAAGIDPPTHIFISNMADELNVSVPPSPRLYEQFFDIVALPGDRLVIEDPRWPAIWSGTERREIVKGSR